MYGKAVLRARRWLLLLLLMTLSGVCYYSWSWRREITPSRKRITTSTTNNRQQRSLATPGYVTLCQARLRDNHRTGNHLFLLAGLLYAALITGRRVSMPKNSWSLDAIFLTDGIERYRTVPNCPCHEFTHPPKISYHGDINLDTDGGRAALRQDRNRTLALCGLYQTYRYADAVATTLRTLLRFRPDVQDTARTILDDGRPTEWAPGSYTRVGLHVRRGDYLDRHWVEYGLTVVDQRFVNHAVDYFTSKFGRVHLVVASDDPRWIGDVLREKLAPVSISSTSRFISMFSHSVAVTLSRGQSPGVDLALLVACDAMIVSTGSFGWWAAWLVNRTTVYYDRWSRVGSRFSREFDRRLYFPPHWIPLR